MQILRPLLILSFALPAFAQEPAAKPAGAPAAAPVAAPAAAPAPAPAPPAGAPGVPLLPPPATAPAEIPLGPFKDIKERHSYGLGIFLGNREKSNAAANPDKPTLNAADILAGLNDGLNGAKSVDYAAGLAMAAQIKRSGVDIDNAVLADAVRVVLEGKEKDARIQQPEVQTIMQEIQNAIQQRQMAKQKEEAEKNLAVSNAFLADNGKKEGVKTAPSGLQYKIDAPGEGATPGAKDLVTINIHGTNIEGADFDKSNPGTPARRSLAALPKGLQEGILLLKPGGKGHFWVPPALGYGEAPRGAALKGNSVLHYEIELVSSEVPPPPPAQPAGGPGAIPGGPRRPISAVTPPVSVDIPASPGKAVSAPVQVPPPAPAPAPAAPAPVPAPAK